MAICAVFVNPWPPGKRSNSFGILESLFQKVNFVLCIHEEYIHLEGYS